MCSDSQNVRVGIRVTTSHLQTVQLRPHCAASHYGGSLLCDCIGNSAVSSLHAALILVSLSTATEVHYWCQNKMIQTYHISQELYEWPHSACQHALQQVNKFCNTFWSSEETQYIVHVSIWTHSLLKNINPVIHHALTAYHITTFTLCYGTSYMPWGFSSLSIHIFYVMKRPLK
jgi:hypothetical protein